MNEEEMIKLVEELKENCQCWLEDEDTCADDRKWYEKEKTTLQDLLDLYNQEKEKNKKLEDEAILLRKTHNYDVKMIDDVKGEAVELYRVIDRMARQISCLSKNLDNATNFERVSEEEYNVDFIKQYYFKKVGEENG